MHGKFGELIIALQRNASTEMRREILADEQAETSSLFA